MPDFRFTVRIAAGETTSGEIAAPSAEAALEQLVGQGYKRESIELKEQPPPLKPAIKPAATADLGEHLAAVTAAQLPLAPALHALAEEAAGSTMGKLLAQLAQRIERGATLDDALKQVHVPPHFAELVRAGQRSNRLTEVLAEFARQERESALLRRRVWAALAYPLLLLAMLLVLGVFFQVTLVRGMAQIYDDFDLLLPRLTEQVVLLSKDHVLWPTLGGFVFAAITLWAVMRYTSLGRRFCWHIPLVGTAARYTSLANSSRLLALLLGAQLPLPEALRLTSRAARDPALAKAYHSLGVQVARGNGLAASVERTKAFPHTLLPFLQWGERTSSLDEAFSSAAEICTERARIQTAVLRTVLPPLIFVLVFAAVLLGVQALLVPLIGLIQNLSGG